MFKPEDYVEPAAGPVIPGLDKNEIVMAKNQPEYNPLRCLASAAPEGSRLSRFSPTPERRQAIADGADIFLELWTFHRPMNPILMAIVKDPVESIQGFRARFEIPEPVSIKPNTEEPLA